MIKFLPLFFSILLTACANRSDFKAQNYSKEEQLLSRGVVDYKNDNYPAAQQKFHRALDLYQSVDNYQGMQLARVNLVETLLALNHFNAAKEQLLHLKQQNKTTGLDETFKERIILLEVKWLFKIQQYRESLTRIEPLLLNLNNQKVSDKKGLELLATAARLEALMHQETEYRWLSKFRKAIAENKQVQPKFQVILKRIDAVIATQNQQYPKALDLLHQALIFYKNQSERRAIAACLEEIAKIEFKQHKPLDALKYLKSALSIRTWLKDQFHVDRIQKIISLQQPTQR